MCIQQGVYLVFDVDLIGLDPRILHGLGVQAGMGCVIFFLPWHLLHLLRVFHGIYRRSPGALIYRILFFIALHSYLYSPSLSVYQGVLQL